MVSTLGRKKIKLFFVVSEDWSFWSHRLSLALAAKEAGYEVTLLTKVNKLEDMIREKGINVVNVNFSRSSSSPFKDLKNVFKLIRIFRKEQPDIVHNVALKTILISSIAAYFNKNIFVINAFTGLGYVFSSSQAQARFIRFFLVPFFRIIFRKSNYYTIFQNPDDMALFRKSRMITSDKSVLIRGSGVDINEFRESPDPNDTPVIMLASRLLWDKGVGEFMEAAIRIKKEGIKAHFTLVGDVDKANPMSIPISTLKQWETDGYVTWKGHSKTMPETLASASIVCLPSYREGLPKVLLEAAAVGRPLIATDVPGCREIVINNKNGILVKLKDVDTLYQAIKTLIEDKSMRTEMGHKGRQLVEAELSTEKVNAETIKLYKKLSINTV